VGNWRILVKNIDVSCKCEQTGFYIGTTKRGLGANAGQGGWKARGAKIQVHILCGCGGGLGPRHHKDTNELMWQVSFDDGDEGDYNARELQKIMCAAAHKWSYGPSVEASCLRALFM
jgi:hypothetical protein